MDCQKFADVVIERKNILDCLLSPAHLVGQCKAEFFQALGYRQLTWGLLERDLRALLASNIGHVRAENAFDGVKYAVSGRIVDPNARTARMLTVWIVEPEQNVLRFVTAYPEGAANAH